MLCPPAAVNRMPGMRTLTPRRIQETLFTAPSFLWLLVLFLVPTLMVVSMSFRTADPYGGIGDSFSLEGFKDIFSPSFPGILFRTVNLSFQTTLWCLALGLPVAYFIARAEKKHQAHLMLLIIIPFWTNFLIRVYAWKIILHPEGMLKDMLVALRLVSEDTSLLYNQGAVLLVLVYTYLPFAVLPLYAAIEKFDFTLIEASRDLGAGPLRSFFRVFLPGISQGIVSAVMVVFIPALGSYVIPDMVGGTDGEMLGNKIAQRVFVDRNLPRGSALSTLLVLAVVLPVIGGLVVKKIRSNGRAFADVPSIGEHGL